MNAELRQEVHTDGQSGEGSRRDQRGRKNRETPKDEKKRAGLGIPYSKIVELLKKMCDKGAVEADFVAGELSNMAQ